MYTGPMKLTASLLCLVLVLLSPGPDIYAAIPEMGKFNAPIDGASGKFFVPPSKAPQEFSPDGTRPVEQPREGVQAPAELPVPRALPALPAPVAPPAVQVQGAQTAVGPIQTPVIAAASGRFAISGQRMNALASRLVDLLKCDVPMGNLPVQASDASQTSSSLRAGEDHQPVLLPSASSPVARKREKTVNVATAAGYLMLEVAVILLFPGMPRIVISGIGRLSGLLTWAGIALAGVGKFLGPKGKALADLSEPPQAGAWVALHLPDTVAIERKAYASAALHRALGSQVGEGSWEDFKAWVLSGATSALCWIPLVLGGMLDGSLFGKNTMSSIKDVPASILGIPLIKIFNGVIASSVLEQIVFLGVVFNGARLLSKRLGRGEIFAGAVSLGLYAVFLLATGYTVSNLVPALAIQAVLTYLYVRSESLFAPALIAFSLSWFGIDSLRLCVGLLKGVPGTLAGLPAWAGPAVAAVGLAVFAAVAVKRHWTEFRWGFFKAAAREELAKLQALGSARAIVLASLFWGVVGYVANDSSYWSVHLIIPQVEPVPEILKRMLLLPPDVLLYCYYAVVGPLEEWVFRGVVFKALSTKLAKWGYSPQAVFWSAAVISSLAFSLAHYVDWCAPLIKMGLVDSSFGGAAMAGAYAFTWAGFAARFVSGMMMAFLYARSGMLIVPIIAHATEDMLESIGLRWGLPTFLTAVAVVMALQIFSPRSPPKVSSERASPVSPDQAVESRPVKALRLVGSYLAALYPSTKDKWINQLWFGVRIAFIHLAAFLGITAAALRLGYHAHPNYRLNLPASPHFWVASGLLFVLSVIGPILEEMFFRGITYGWCRDMLAKHIGQAKSILIVGAANAILYTVFHETSDPVCMATRMIWVLLLMYAFQKGGLISSIAAHITSNFILLLPYFLAKGVGLPVP